MAERRFRTKGYRRVQVRTPGGRAAQIYKGRRSGTPKCASCGRPLSGVPSQRSEVGSSARSSKAPNRPFGGHFCPACLRSSIKERARA